MTTREILAFFIGAQTFHTLSHIILRYSGTLPITFWTITWTQQLNLIAIACNALVTLLLVWWFVASGK